MEMYDGEYELPARFSVLSQLIEQNQGRLDPAGRRICSISQGYLPGERYPWFYTDSGRLFWKGSVFPVWIQMEDGVEIPAIAKEIWSDPGIKLSNEKRALVRAMEAGIGTFPYIADFRGPQSGFLITEFLGNVIPLARCAISSLEDLISQVTIVRDLLRSVHNAGILHGDCETQNLSVVGPTIYDFVYSELFPDPVPVNRRSEDLIPLAKDLNERAVASPLSLEITPTELRHIINDILYG